MSMVDFSTANKGKQPPPIGGDPKDQALKIKEWIDAGIYYDHPLRRRDLSRNRQYELFDQCIQWLQRAAAPNDGAGEYTSFVDMAWMGNSLIPMPTFNEGLGARQNETARLARPNYRPVVKAKGTNPGLKAREAAEAMQNALRHRIRESEADRDMSLFYYHLPLYGGVWMKSERVATWDKTHMVPVLDAVACSAPECDFALADPTLTPDQAAKLPGGAAAALAQPVQGSMNVKATACPQCPDHPALQPFQPTLEEAGSMQDALGQPMGREEPLCDWELSIRYDSDMFPRNMGFDMKPGRVDEWVEVHVESLDWVALRYPDKAGDVKPENPAALAQWHPVAAQPDLYQGILTAGKTFDNSVRIKERHKKPWMEMQVGKDGQPVKDPRTGRIKYAMNKGRSVIMAGEVVLLDSTYLFESSTHPGEWIPRCEMEYVVWEFRDGGRRLRGLGLWDVMLDPQKAANDVRSQTQAIRQRMAVPIYVTNGNFEIQSMKGGIPGMWANMNVEPGMPVEAPTLWNNVTIDEGVRYELEDAIQFLQRAGHLVEVERGQPPPGVSAASALELLKGAASEGREARLERIQRSLERLWRHGERVIKAVWLEPREVKSEDEDGKESWAYLQATDFEAETEVGVEGEPDYDEKTKAIEVFRDMVDKQLIDPRAIRPRKVSALLGGPKDFWQAEEQQQKAAEREWETFKTSGEVPYVDPGLDDHGEHYERHGLDAQSEYFRDLEAKANWEGALRILSAWWRQTKQQILMSLLYMPNGMCAQDQVFMMWGQQLQGAIAMGQFQVTDAQALMLVMKWRAHHAAHAIEETASQMEAQMQPTLPAPGSTDQTAAGTLPTAGAPPVQGQVAVAGGQQAVA